eukprot:8960463-Alexandrium_andersonii.AAC.1
MCIRDRPLSRTFSQATAHKLPSPKLPQEPSEMLEPAERTDYTAEEYAAMAAALTPEQSSGEEDW